jgi:hypothetical protein
MWFFCQGLLEKLNAIVTVFNLNVIFRSIGPNGTRRPIQ